MVWRASNRDRHGAPPRTLSVLLLESSIETHLNWLELVLSVIKMYLKYKLNFMIYTFQITDVI